MSSHRFRLVAVVVLIGAALPTATARAQTIPAACRPVVDAQRKTLMTAHHLYVTDGRTAKTPSGEMISVSGASYVLYEGKWSRSPISLKGQLDQMQENIANAKVFSCKHVGGESVGGVPADVYTSHDEHDGSVDDGRIWVAKASGLVLRIEDDLDAGAGGKQHMSMRYEYANVRAPAGVK